MDTDLQMTENNRVEYKFYEKPMSSSVTVQKVTAMDENQKVKTLSNELTRRLLNTSEALVDEDRVMVVDNYTQKLMNSGFGVEQIRKIIVNGILAYERKLRESRSVSGRKLHRTAQESGGRRMRKKLLDKTEWFRGKKKKVEPDDQTQSNIQGSGRRSNKQQTRRIQHDGGANNVKELKTRTILFVEQTRDGKLAKELREVFRRLEGILGFRVKVVERTGSSLKSILPNTNPWSGSSCGREKCVTCTQGTEDMPTCTKRNLVYENICLSCNPEAANKGPLPMDRINTDIPSVYIGETSRSVYERAREHWDDFRKGDEDSHILKHWAIHHASVGEPRFVMKVVGFHKTALSRQVGEAV